MRADFSVFFGTDTHVLNDLERASYAKKFGAGSLVVGEEDQDTSVFYIVDGSATALRYGEDGAEVFIDRFGAGDLMGEMSVLGNGKRSADIFALSDLQVKVFPGDTFLKLMEKHGVIGLNVSKLLANRIRTTTHRMFEQSTLSSKGRVCAELMRMASPTEKPPSLRINEFPTISQLAKTLGIARETVSRTISDLKAKGIIEKCEESLCINEPQALVDKIA